MVYGRNISSHFPQTDFRYSMSSVVFISAIPPGASFFCNAAESPPNMNLSCPEMEISSNAFPHGYLNVWCGTEITDLTIFLCLFMIILKGKLESPTSLMVGRKIAVSGPGCGLSSFSRMGKENGNKYTLMGLSFP